MRCLTGHAANSKFGTKLSAIKQLPEVNLLNFGSDPRIGDVEEMIEEGEKYLVLVIKQNSSCKSMNELRYDIYHHKKSIFFLDLPPTSLETRVHCLRAIYNTYLYKHAMRVKSMPFLNPKDYGYEELDGLLVPSRYTQLQPEDLIQPCNCTACATPRCKCRAAVESCCVYCKCSGKVPPCKNPSINHNVRYIKLVCQVYCLYTEKSIGFSIVLSFVYMF